MNRSILSVAVVAGVVVLSCKSAQTPQSAAPQPLAPSQGVQPSAPNPAGPPGPRRAPNPVAQDSARRAQVDSIMRTIAGREMEPAGTVFKNVKLLKDMPAAEFLKNMDVNYGRGLGMSCGNCHVLGKFDEDTRKNKRVARDMQELVTYINTVRLAQIKDLDEDYTKITCVTCHAGSGHPKTTMAVPPPPSTIPR